MKNWKTNSLIRSMTFRKFARPLQYFPVLSRLMTHGKRPNNHLIVFFRAKTQILALLRINLSPAYLLSIQLLNANDKIFSITGKHWAMA